MISNIKKILLLSLFVVVFPFLSSGQYVSKDNNTGAFTDDATWIGGVAPDPSLRDTDTKIYGRVTSYISLTIDNGNIMDVYDTLFIKGDLTVKNDANFIIHESAVCIIYGNVDIKNKVDLAFGSTFIVTGDFTATGSQATIDIQDGAAVYILGTNDSPLFSCDNTGNYDPPGDAVCDYGDIISLEDNENETGGIYDVFVSDDSLKGVTPVYVELCDAGDATVETLFKDGTSYQWRDSLGTALAGETGMSFTTNIPGEYFATFDYDGGTITTHRIKIKTPHITAEFDATDVSCPGATDGTITFFNPSGGSGSYEYSIDGGANWYTSETFANLAEGTYNLQVKDSGGTCSTVLNNTFLLTSTDYENPLITCPADITQLSDAGVCYAAITYLGNIVLSDNCTAVSDLTPHNDAPASNRYSVGTRIINWSVTDEAGNMATCQQSITINPAEIIDVAVSDLGNTCQDGETGTTTTLIWDLVLIAGAEDWTFDYTINDGSTDVQAGTGVAAQGDTQIFYEMTNSTATDKTYTLTIFNVVDECGTVETENKQ